MSTRVSARIEEFVRALPLHTGLRVLEVGCGPGVAAREVLRRIGKGYVLAIDRSETAVALAIKGSVDEIATGMLEFRRAAVEDFKLLPDDDSFDLAFAMRVGALDGRHPELETRALERIKAALRPGGRLFIDGGDPVSEICLD